MCLLAVAFRTHPESPLIVAANRDEWLARPATTPARFEPGVVAGRDLVAGGTWLAANAHGVIASLTNLPGPPAGRRRSRGELPLLLARQPSAAQAAAAFTVQPRDYNPAWLLVGDRDALFYLDLTGAELQVTALEPGLHVLENRPLGAPSPKAALVRARLLAAMAERGDALVHALATMLSSHDIPDGANDPRRPRETEAACVHAGPYGTRSSTIVILPPGPGVPRLRFTDGPPCTSPWSGDLAATAFAMDPPPG